MSEYRRVRRVRDGMIFEATRYGNEDGSWDKECITRVAGFILGLNPDVSTTVGNERILDVVRPVLKDFDPVNGKATIEVADWTSEHIFSMELGDWILKSPNTSFIFVKPYAFAYDFEDVPIQIHAKSEYDELADLIYENFPWDGETYQAVAEKVAAEVIKAGWAKTL